MKKKKGKEKYNSKRKKRKIKKEMENGKKDNRNEKVKKR
jgi:hypothetical protein